MEIEDEVEFAHVAEVFVEDFHKGVDELEHDELVVGLVYDHDEIEAGIALVHDLVVLVVHEIAHFGFTRDHQLVYLHPPAFTSLRNRCFSICDMFDEYHLVSRDRPCLLIRKKQWIILFNLININSNSKITPSIIHLIN